MQSYKITVQGKVQGVYYRKTIHEKARKLRIKGYIKNLSNGNVEVGVRLEERQYNLFLDILKQGSSSSKVINVKIEKTNTSFDNFSIRY